MDRDKDTEKRPCEVEADIEMIQLHTKEGRDCQELPEPEETRKDSSLEPSEDHDPADTLIWTSGLQN